MMILSIPLDLAVVKPASSINKQSDLIIDFIHNPMTMDTHPINTAYFAAGCFWGIEVTFQKVPGVINTTVGYMGGILENPGYEIVCSGTTGHAETVAIQFDPKHCAYEDLLDTFWACHDPTTLNRQGPDIGTQYRSAIFTIDEQQQAAALKSKQFLETKRHFSAPITTEITAAPIFYPAEAYHQNYIARRNQQR